MTIEESGEVSMAHTTPYVHDSLLTYHQDEQVLYIPVESAAWWEWLANRNNKTFRFLHPGGDFTARREWKNRAWYWYAYRKHQGKLHKAYLGKSTELKLAHLSAIAQQLTLSLSVPSQEEQRLAVPAIEHEASQIEQASNVAVGAPASSNLVLITKLFPPPARSELVPRPRLMRLLNIGLLRKLTIISAPAGSGKSTLLSAWSNVLPTAPRCAWLSLDAADNDPVRFWSYVVAALQRISPDLGEKILPMLQAAPLPPIESILTLLINELAFTPIVLLLDDYHTITTPVIHDTITFLLNHLPSHLHLIIASRTDPPLPLAQLRAQGELNEIRAPDLRFTLPEIHTFLKQTCGLDLSRQEIALLDKHTEGWVVGLQLAALSMQGRKDITHFIAGFTGGHRYILDYLTSEVLNRQPTHVRDFLLHTSILERLSAPLCNAILLRNDGRELLEQVEQANLFLIPLDEKRQWYRYHHLFAEFLQARLLQLYPELVPQLHRRASQWYAHYGLVSATVDHALATRDMSYAASLIEQFAPTMIRRSEVVMLLHWLALLPTEVLQANPRLLMFRAGSYTTIGQIEAAEACVESLEDMLSHMKQYESVETSQKFEGELLAVQVALAAFRTDLPRAIELSHRALAIADPADTFTRSIVTLSQGFAYFLSGELEQAVDVFAAAIKLGKAAQNHHIFLSAMACQGRIQVAHGLLYQAASTYQQTIALGTREGGRLFSAVCTASISLSELMWEWNNAEAAERYAQEGLALGAHWGNVGMLAQGYTILAQIQCTRGNIVEAQALMEQAEQLLHGCTFPAVISIAHANHAWLHLLTGNLEAATQWVQVSHLSEHEILLYPREIEHLILVQIYIAQGRLIEACQIIERYLPVLEARERIYTLLDCLILHAIILYKQGHLQRALTIFTRALVLAAPEGYIRIFLNKGEPVVMLLHLVRVRSVPAAPKAYLNQLIALVGPLLYPISPDYLLSERELDVLQHIAAGKANQQIAQEFTIALSTVKTHINNIYTRLGVHSRTQAVARAKELGLLP